MTNIWRTRFGLLLIGAAVAGLAIGTVLPLVLNGTGMMLGIAAAATGVALCVRKLRQLR